MLKNLKTATVFLLLISIAISTTFLCYADNGDKPVGEQSVTASTDGSPQPRRSCLNRGSATLTLISGRNIVIDAEATAYHAVDRFRVTIYLEKSKNGSSSTVTSWTVSEYNTDKIDMLRAYTVDEAASYRLLAVFSTQHQADGVGTEGAAAATSWMWID